MNNHVTHLIVRKWDGKNINDTISVASKDVRSRNTGNKKKHWVNNECQEAVSKRNEAKIKMLRNKMPEITVEKQFMKTIINKKNQKGENIGGKVNIGKLE